MIFNSKEAERLYWNFLVSDNKLYLDQACVLAIPLIEAICVSVDPQRYDDLKQEASLKLYQLLSNRKYDPSRGTSLYSFLNRTLRNCMIDYIRKDRTCDELDENCSYAPDEEPAVVLDMSIAQAYMLKRFPSLHPTVVKDATAYVISAYLELTSHKHERRIVRTLESFYQFSRKLAYTFHKSVLTFLRLYMTSPDTLTDNLEFACSQVNGSEMSLRPELALAAGKVAYQQIAAVLAGSYVKL